MSSSTIFNGIDQTPQTQTNRRISQRNGESGVGTGSSKASLRGKRSNHIRSYSEPQVSQEISVVQSNQLEWHNLESILLEGFSIPIPHKEEHLSQ
jgi:hypothetical protein